jgi:hypothetical protein
MHGALLIDRVIDQVRRKGWVTRDAPDLKEPVPLAADAIEKLQLSGDRPLPPSLARWLSFDASWLAEVGWYESGQRVGLAGRSLGDTAAWLYGSDDDPLVELFSAFETLLPERCFPLVGGSDSRRLLYAGMPDSIGEYPVLVTDIDDAPYVAVMYPGLDVYLAELAGVIDLEFDTYTSLMDHPDYGARMREHVAHTGLGNEGLDVQFL